MPVTPTLRKLAPGVSYANVTATLALIIALGGTSYAAITPEPVNVDVPQAGEQQRDAATFAFGGQVRAKIGQQGTGPAEHHPGAGIFEVLSADGRRSQFTHYQYGTAIRSYGPFSNIMELWLGDAGTWQPNLSVRGGLGNGFGAIVQARNAADTSGLALDYYDALRPRLTVESNGAAPGSTLAIENPEPAGSLALATRVGGQVVDHFRLDNSGRIRMGGPVDLGDSPVDSVRLHGSTRSGLPVPDPGALSTNLKSRDVNHPSELAQRLNEMRTVINALRLTLLEHGMVTSTR